MNMRNWGTYKKRISAEKMYLTADIPMGQNTLTFVSFISSFINVSSNFRFSQLQFISSPTCLNTYAPSNSSLNFAVVNLIHCNIKSKLFIRKMI